MAKGWGKCWGDSSGGESTREKCADCAEYWCGILVLICVFCPEKKARNARNEWIVSRWIRAFQIPSRFSGKIFVKENAAKIFFKNNLLVDIGTSIAN